MLFLPLFIECYRKIHYFSTPSVPFCFLAARFERWRRLEHRGVQVLLFLSYFGGTRPFRDEPSVVVQCCVDAAGAHWKQQPLVLCCSWSPEQPDLLMVQVMLPAGGVRLLPVPCLLPEAGSVNSRVQACPWAVCALGWWVGHTSGGQHSTSQSVCPALSSSQSPALRREEKMTKTGKK